MLTLPALNFRFVAVISKLSKNLKLQLDTDVNVISEDDRTTNPTDLKG